MLFYLFALFFLHTNNITNTIINFKKNNYNDGSDHRFPINQKNSTNDDVILNIHSNFEKHKLLQILEDKDVSYDIKLYLINNLFNILDW
jgi:hypothetical protein